MTSVNMKWHKKSKRKSRREPFCVHTPNRYNYIDKMKENETKQRLAEAVSPFIDNEPNPEGDSL